MYHLHKTHVHYTLLQGSYFRKNKLAYYILKISKFFVEVLRDKSLLNVSICNTENYLFAIYFMCIYIDAFTLERVYTGLVLVWKCISLDKKRGEEGYKLLLHLESNPF